MFRAIPSDEQPIGPDDVSASTKTFGEQSGAYNGGSSTIFGAIGPPAKTQFHNFRSTALQLQLF